MAKIDDNLNITINIRWLVQIVVIVALIVGTWYQAQMKFAEQERRIKDLENKIVILNASIEGMETQHIEDLEEQNRTLMQRLGLKKP